MERISVFERIWRGEGQGPVIGWRIIGTALLSTALVGCAAGPRVQSPDAASLGADREYAGARADIAETEGMASWWT
ncbi:MAG: hypothetical protein K2Q06_07635, partial [Parvularculaceae bacterium]|nr:hypothetical protein [Parvularculaceae bacterium]